MENDTCYLVYYMKFAEKYTDSTTYLYNIFYSRQMSEKYYKDKLEELRPAIVFNKHEYLILAKIPIDVLDKTNIEDYIGKIASKELARIVTDIYPLYMIKKTCLGRM